MAEANPVAEESTVNRSSSHQILGAEVHLKTNASCTYGEANSALTALAQEELPGADLLLNQLFHSNITDHGGNKLNFTGYIQQRRR